MKKIKIVTTVFFALAMSLTSVTSNQSNISIIKNGLSLTEMKLEFNKTYAAENKHQKAYDLAKKYINIEAKSHIIGINELLRKAKISSCNDIPLPDTKAFYKSTEERIYSSSLEEYVPNEPDKVHIFPIESVSNKVTFNKKIEIKKIITSFGSEILKLTSIVFLDCASGAMELRIMDKIDYTGSDLVIAYYKDKETNLQSIIMFYDYEPVNNDPREKMAFHYIEENQEKKIINYAYYGDSTYDPMIDIEKGSIGKLEVNNLGEVGSVSVLVNSVELAKDLENLTYRYNKLGFTIEAIQGCEVFNKAAAEA